MAFRHDAVRQLQHLGRRLGVQGGGVLVQQQQLGLFQGGHQQRQRLALSAGEEAYLAGQPILQPQVQIFQHLLVLLLLRLGHAPAEAPPLAPAGRQGQVLQNLHGRRGAQHGVLEDPADIRGPLVVRQVGYVHAADGDGPAVHGPGPRHGVQKGGFARPVAADDGTEVPVLQRQAHAPEGLFLVDRPGVENLPDFFYFKHGWRLPS